MRSLIVQTAKRQQIVDMTDEVTQILKTYNIDKGLCHLFLTHTTAAITTADLDPGTDLDMLEVFEKLIPQINFRHAHDSLHTPSHILSSIIGTSLTVPVKDSGLVLGTWQRVVLIEFDGPKPRNVVMTLFAE